MIPDPRKIPYPRKIEFAFDDASGRYRIDVDGRPWGWADPLIPSHRAFRVHQITPQGERRRGAGRVIEARDIRDAVEKFVIADRKEHRRATPR